MLTYPKAITVGKGVTLFPYSFSKGLHPLQAPWAGMLSLSNPKGDAGQIKLTILKKFLFKINKKYI